uniref:Uncharacterized protein n=1 Tax=Nelumbo nucifera TaxID=4432 RepID=A0A822YJD9_NELNU|nr:TPA_asm: hypothetical protein HUJ06_030956 [Nelumbo nucifera]
MCKRTIERRLNYVAETLRGFDSESSRDEAHCVSRSEVEVLEQKSSSSLSCQRRPGNTPGHSTPPSSEPSLEEGTPTAGVQAEPNLAGLGVEPSRSPSVEPWASDSHVERDIHVANSVGLVFWGREKFARETFQRFKVEVEEARAKRKNRQ